MGDPGVYVLHSRINFCNYVCHIWIESLLGLNHMDSKGAVGAIGFPPPTPTTLLNKESQTLRAAVHMHHLQCFALQI